MREIPVLVVGGGPVGLALAAELGWRGVGCLLVEKNPGINNHPRANVVASRTMEHFRRWGIADRVARAGLPLDYPVEIVFATRITGQEIFRFSFPSYADCEQAGDAVRARLPDLAHSPYFKTSVGQNHLEPVLRDFAGSQRGAEVRFGWRLDAFTQDADGVSATLVEESSGKTERVRAGYMAACDGARGPVRAALGIDMAGRKDLGRFLGIYLRAPGFAKRHKLGRATLYWALNGDSQGIFIAIDGREHFTFQLALRPGQEAEGIDPRRAIDAAYGEPLECEVISIQPWRAHAAVAERYRAGRVFLAGDAAHLFTPTGGFGMNTGIADAVDLGWKLAAVISGWGGEGLLDAYEAERRPVGVRNTDEAADNYLKVLPVFKLGQHCEAPGDAGAQARGAIAAAMAAERKHFAATGIHLGYRYEGSPLVVPDGSAAPPDDPSRYVPVARPGSRAPHLWLGPGRSTLDLFGQGFTLLRIGGSRAACGALQAAATAAGVPLALVDLPGDTALRAYERPLVLVRPDGHVAWRGDRLPEDAAALLDQVRGAASRTLSSNARTNHETA